MLAFFASLLTVGLVRFDGSPTLYVDHFGLKQVFGRSGVVSHLLRYEGTLSHSKLSRGADYARRPEPSAYLIAVDTVLRVKRLV